MSGLAGRARGLLRDPGRTGAALFACLAAAALAAAAFVVHSRQAELAVDVPRLTRSFTPAEGERARIDVRVLEPEAAARVSILDSDRFEVATVAERLSLEAGRAESLRWDGRDAAGEVVGPGRYKVRIQLPAAGRDARWIKNIRVLDPEAADDAAGER